MFSRRLGLALVVAMLCLGGPTAHAQASPVNYWIPGWPMGFSGAAGESPDAYGNFPSFDFRDVGNGSSYARYNFSNGFFVGSQRSNMGFSGLSQSAFGSFGSLYSEGVQFGYSLKNGGGPPVTFYAGFDTLKYNTGSVARSRRSTTNPARCLSVARMPVSNSSRRRISACRLGSVSSSSRAASTARSTRSPAPRRSPSAVAATRACTLN